MSNAPSKKPPPWIQQHTVHIFLYRQEEKYEQFGDDDGARIMDDIEHFMYQLVTDTFERHISVEWNSTITSLPTEDEKDREFYMTVVWEQPIWQFWSAGKLQRQLEDTIVLIDRDGQVVLA